MFACPTTKFRFYSVIWTILIMASPLLAQTGMQQAFCEFGVGVASNPQLTLESNPMVMLSRRAGVHGSQRAQGVGIRWMTFGEQTKFSNSDVPSLSRLGGLIQVDKSLSSAVRTGVDAAVDRGVGLEQDWRGREAWRAFERTLWQGTWWLELFDKGRTGRMTVQRGGAAYSSSRGYSRGTFGFGAELEIPAYCRVRGKLGLDKVGQSRTQHAGAFMFSLNHRQQNFLDWNIGEGALPAFDFLRADAVSIREMDAANRMWLTTEFAAGYGFPVFRGLQSGVQFAYAIRQDAGVESHDSQASEAQIWFETEQRQWNLRGTASYSKQHMANQQIFGENGWAAYAFNVWHLEARGEFRIATDWRLFAAFGARGFDSDALPVGWYQRSSWRAISAETGVVWTRSNESRWERRHAQLLRLPTKAPEFIP